LTTFLDWLSSPTTQSRIAAAAAMDDLILHRQHQSGRAKALTHLISILDDAATDPVERRRAASAILRPIHRRPLAAANLRASAGTMGGASRFASAVLQGQTPPP